MKDPFRLGKYRRKCRQYSVHQRPTGRSCNDSVREETYLKCAAILLVCGRRLKVTGMNVSRANKHKKLALLLLGLVCSIRQPRLLVPDRIVSKVITINTFSEQECDMYFGFTKDELYKVCTKLDIPLYFTINEGKHQFKVPGEKSVLYMLYHYRCPSVRQTLDSTLFGYDYSVLSKLFNKCVEYVHNRHSTLFRNIPSVVHKFDTYNAAIIDKIRSEFPNDALPADAVDCALFADNCRFQLARPSGEFYIQRAYYSGHKKMHNIGVQCVQAPDGIIYDIFDAPVGRHQDRWYMDKSEVNGIMGAVQLVQQRQLWIYTDKGYNIDTHIRAAAHGPGPVTELQTRNNYIMSKERVGIEWNFGFVRMRCPLVDIYKKMKLQENDVRMRVKVAILLTNMCTCLRGNGTSRYFNMLAPTLDEYMNV